MMQVWLMPGISTYQQFVADFLPLASSDPHEANGKLSPRDTALDQIYKDLARSRKNNFAFYQNEVRPTWSCPLSPLPDDPSGSESDAEGQARSQGRKRKRKVPRLDCRHALLRRLEMINTDYAASVRTSSRVPSTASASASLTDRDSTMSEASSTATTATSSTFSKGKWREQLHPGGNVPEPSPSGTGSAFEFDSELDRSENASVAEEASAQTGPMSPPIYLSPPSPSGGSSDSSFASAVEGSEPAPDETPKPDTSQAFDAPKPPPKGAESFQRPNGVARSDAERPFADLQWHSLLRILYIYALLNPSTGYIQGMNEVLFVIHYVLGSSGHHSPAFDTPLQGSPELDPSTGNASDPSIEDFGQDDDFEGPATHAEADAFWCFSALIGEVRELYEFEGVDHGAAGLRILSPRLPVEGNSGDVGMAGALKRLSLRLKWLDPDLWKNLVSHAYLRANVEASGPMQRSRSSSMLPCPAARQFTGTPAAVLLFQVARLPCQH